jgi:hypothetical protein
MIANLELESRPHLLALDLGLRFGWACYTEEARLVAYGSHHCASRAKLKNIAWMTLNKLPENSLLYIEGGGILLPVWTREATRRSIEVQTLSAELWRADCLLPREQKTGSSAKRRAQEIARSLITQQSGRAPISLRHDTAEATLLGWWALYQ